MCNKTQKQKKKPTNVAGARVSLLSTAVGFFKAASFSIQRLKVTGMNIKSK